jgi:hypothetical protein
VIEDLFAGQLDEQAVLAKHGLGRNTFNKWLTDEAFRQQFDQRIESAYRQSQLIVARYAPLAAAKLVELTNSDSQETARKACLDIISLRASHAILPKPDSDEGRQVPSTQDSSALHLPQLSDETASKILSALAEEQ